MAKRLDSFGIEVEVGDIVLSAPRHKYSGKPEVGQVCGVFDSGRVTIKLPTRVAIYAYQRGAPDVEQVSYRYVYDNDAEPNAWGRKPQKRERYTYMAKDYTVVGQEWKWLRKQAADTTLVIIRKEGEEKKDLTELLAERVGFNELSRNLNLNYDAVTPELD